MWAENSPAWLRGEIEKPNCFLDLCSAFSHKALQSIITAQLTQFWAGPVVKVNAIQLPYTMLCERPTRTNETRSARFNRSDDHCPRSYGFQTWQEP